MYITITPTTNDSLIAHGPYPEPVAVTEPTICLAAYPRPAVSRITWHLNHPHEYTTTPTTLTALPEQRPAILTVADLNAPTIAVIIHPLTRKTLAVGPFTSPDHAEQWWHISVNPDTNGDALCHILPLTTPNSDTGEGDQR